MVRRAERPAGLAVAVLLVSLAIAGCDLFLSPEQRADRSIDGAAVVYFADYAVGTDQVLAGLQTLAEQDVIGLTVAESRASVVAAMAGTPKPDVVVYFNQNTWLAEEDEDALVTWVETGRRLIYADWTWNGRVLAAVQTGSAGSQNEGLLAFEDDRLTVGVANPLPLANPDPGWGTWSMGLLPVGGSVSVAEFPSGASGLIYGNEGRTITVGFLSDTVREDDGRNFIRNLLRVVIEGSK